MKFDIPLYVNFIPNQPEIRTNRFTQIIDMLSKKYLPNDDKGSVITSSLFGAPKAKKSA